MRDFLLYFAGFLVLLMLQEFILSSVHLFTLISPFVYIMIIIMLPMQIKPIPTIIFSMLVGVVMDIFMGTSALCSISMIFLGFIRPLIIKLTIPQDLVKAGGVPFSKRVGIVNFLKYCTLFSLLYAAVYFSIEVMSSEMILHTALRAALSSVVTILLILILQNLVSGRVKKSF